MSTIHNNPSAPVLSVNEMKVELSTSQGWVPIIEDLSFTVSGGETIGLVGESGAGKSVTVMSLMRLLPIEATRISGQAMFGGINLTTASLSLLNKVRGKRIGMIFQDPGSSLNPGFTVGEQIAEVVRRHEGLSRSAAWKRAIEALDRVAIPSPAARVNAYPHELSGGMAQRVMIAMAIVCRPELLIADEPTTALDVTTQWRVLDLLREIQAENQMGIILVTHDLGMVSEFCDRAVVMYAGEAVEYGTSRSLLRQPRHPYTSALIEAMPFTALQRDRVLRPIAGTVPGPLERHGCRFHERCSYMIPACATSRVAMTSEEDRTVRCLRSNEILQYDGVPEDVAS